MSHQIGESYDENQDGEGEVNTGTNTELEDAYRTIRVLVGHFLDTSHPRKGHGLIGYVVATWNPEGRWEIDWDGKLHPHRERAETEFALCREAGWECCIASVRLEGTAMKRPPNADLSGATDVSPVFVAEHLGRLIAWVNRQQMDRAFKDALRDRLDDLAEMADAVAADPPVYVAARRIDEPTSSKERTR